MNLTQFDCSTIGRSQTRVNIILRWICILLSIACTGTLFLPGSSGAIASDRLSRKPRMNLENSTKCNDRSSNDEQADDPELINNGLAI